VQRVSYYLSCHAHHILQANNVTGKGQQAGDVEMTDTNGKLLSFIPCTPRRLQANNLNDIVFQWNEFYTRAIALRNKGEEAIEKEECYGFPKDDDPTLDAACDALSDALKNASRAMVEHDTAEVKQKLDNLQKVYDEAAKSNTVTVRYIDAEPPSAPFSPLVRPKLNRILLARSWMKELIHGLRNKSLESQLLVIGNPGSGEVLRLFFLPLMPSSVCTANYNPGKSVALVGYLLFYLIAQSERTILQLKLQGGSLGLLFDHDGVHEVFENDYRRYADGKPCCLLVSADGKHVHPVDELQFCDKTIAVTSPNLKSKTRLENWRKQSQAEQFIAPPPSCLEVVYLL